MCLSNSRMSVERMQRAVLNESGNRYGGVGDARSSVYGDLTVMYEKLDRELARLLFKQAPLVSISLYALLAIVLYLFWGTLPHQFLVPWSIVNFVFATALVVLTWKYHFGKWDIKADGWIRIYTILTFLQDIAWGLIGPLSFLSDNDVYKMLTLFMLGGMAAGGIGTRAVVFETYIVSILSLLSPIIVAMAIYGDSVTGSMLVLTVVFLLFMISVAKNYSKSIRNNILLWLDNEELIAELVESKKEIEDANSVLVSEIDNRMKIEEELLLAKERAEQASAAKNQFLANVSHELRTPLNGIIGFNAILKKSGLTADNEIYVAQIAKSAKTLLNMVNDILDITSIEAGHLKLCERPFLLRVEISDVMAVVSTMAKQKALVLNCEVDENVPDTLAGDPDRLKQVLSNIVGNAIKYTACGSVSVHVKCLSSSADEANIGVEVEDTGMGIPESVQPYLFENFTQGESFDNKKSEGVGLGLAIVKNLLEKMGGTIQLESVEGKGSLFRFNLPFRITTVDTPVAKEKPVEAATQDSMELSWGALRVLIVDDNDVNRMVLASFLGQLGINYEEASSGGSALARIEKKDFDVVLMDIQMPDISGIEVAAKVKRMNRARPSLIAVTAHAFPQQRDDILKSGFVDCLIKPISESDLIRVFNQVGSGLAGRS